MTVRIRLNHCNERTVANQFLEAAHIMFERIKVDGGASLCLRRGTGAGSRAVRQAAEGESWSFTVLLAGGYYRLRLGQPLFY